MIEKRLKGVNNMIYGYARISTHRQNLQRQLDNLRDYAKEIEKDIVIISEVFTGTKTDEREKYQRLKNQLKKGDTLIFDSISRMSRNADEGIKEYFELMEKGVELIFLKEHYIDTKVYQDEIAKSQNITTTDQDLNNTIMKGIREYLIILAKKQIQIAFNQAEKEVLDLRKRTSEALQAKKINEGIILGRRKGAKVESQKSKEMKVKIRKLSKNFDGNLKDKEIIELLGIASNTFYKYKKEMRG